MTQEKPKGPSAPGAGLPLFDPLEMWRKALNQFEQQANDLGSQSLQSQEVRSMLHQASSMTVQWQQIMGGLLDKYFKAVNLPSRKDIQELALMLRTIDEKLDRLLPVEAPPNTARPTRGRRPAVSAQKEAPQSASTPAPSGGDQA